MSAFYVLSFTIYGDVTRTGLDSPVAALFGLIRPRRWLVAGAAFKFLMYCTQLKTAIGNPYKRTGSSAGDCDSVSVAIERYKERQR